MRALLLEFVELFAFPLLFIFFSHFIFGAYVLDLVKTERNISSDNIRLISDGRIFTGAQAKKINLVDYIGNEDDAIEWLKKEAQINGEINLVDFSQEEKISSLFNFSIFKNFINNVSFYPTGLYALWSANYE